MKKSEEIKLDGSDYQSSLTKLLGKKIVDIGFYVSKEFDDPVLNVCGIILEDGTTLSLEGEHDIAYIPFDDDIEGLGEEQLESLYKEDNPDETED